MNETPSNISYYVVETFKYYMLVAVKYSYLTGVTHRSDVKMSSASGLSFGSYRTWNCIAQI